MPNEALIVIDVQESFRRRPLWSTASNPDIVSDVNRLVDAARIRGDHVVWVLHAEPGSGGVFDPASGHVRLIMDLRSDIRGRHVVLCEGVVDSGRSVKFILDLLDSRGAASIQVATLLDKAPCRKIPVPVHYKGWTIGDEFVIGYGMDAAERYRNLPYVGVLEEASE